MKDGTIICNAGHYNMEIDVKALETLSEGKELVRDGIHGYRVDGKRLYLLHNPNLPKGPQDLPKSVNEAACRMSLGL